MDTDSEGEDEEELRRQRMREFNELVHILFTKPERLILYKILKDYQRRRDVARLVVGLDLLLRTYTKLELLKYVRYFVWHGHLDEFDRLTQFHSKFRRRRNHHKKTHLLTPDHRSVASTSTAASGRHVKDVRVFTVHRNKDEPSLGFCVRGGSEHGLGIYVSEIDAGSTAESSGLEVGDKILEVNNISLKGVSSSTAVKLLTGSNRLKLVVQRTRKIPEWRLSREKTSWYDVHNKKLMSGEFEECGISHNIRGLQVEVPERRINLKFGKANRSLGFNIRGGREFSLGIYVSKVDRGGVAEANGVRPGDQIIDVNGIPFENITHANAVEVLKGKKHLILTLRDVGRYPVYKELYAEYTWSDGHIKPGSSTMNLRDIHVKQLELPAKAQSMSDLFSNRRRPSALHNEIFLPHDRNFPTAGASDHDKNNMNIDDDTDSLIDLDQWAKDIQDTGTDNYAYVDDEQTHKIESSETKNVSNNSQTRENNMLVKSSTSRGEENIVTEREEEIEGDYDTPDMIYAKINKRDERYASTSNVSFTTLKESDIRGIDRKEETVRPSTSHEDISITPYRASEDRQRSSNEDLHSISPSVEGALYSTVRRLSGGSFKNLTGSTLSIYGSDESLKDKVIDNRFDTLEARSEHKIYQKHTFTTASYPGNKDSDSEDEHGAGFYDLTSPYVANKSQYENQQLTKSDDKSNLESKNGSDQLDMETLEERLEELQARQTTIGLQELNTLNVNNQDMLISEGSVRKKGKWRTFKNRIKGSLRLKSPSHTKKLSLKSRGSTDIPEYTVPARRGWKDEKVDSVSLAQLEEAAKKLLDEDEFRAVKRHIKTYHEKHDVERLVEVLLVILDKPEKLTLLKDVRGVIFQHDMVQFDNMVNHYEIEAYQKLSLKLHLPLNHKPQKKPRRKLITPEIAEDGHFHIKTMDRYKKQQEVVVVMRENVQQSRSRHTSPLRQGNIVDEKSALDEFEYLDFEHSDEGSCIAAFSDNSSYGTGDVEKIPGSVIVHLSKTKQSIGIDFVEEMANGIREVKIDRIDSKGAANDDSTIEPGMTILAVDRHRVEGCSLEEVCGIIDTSYMDKQHVSLRLVLRKPESTNF